MKKYFNILLLLLSFSFGNAQTWNWAVADKNIGNAYTDPLSLATDVSGNIFQAGLFADSIRFGTYGLDNVYALSAPFLTKYNSSGVPVWAKCGVLLNNSSQAWPYSIATDKSGNILMTGWYTGQVTFGSNILSLGRNYGSAFIAKYDMNGNVLWANTAIPSSSSSYSSSYSVATDNNGNSFITGTFNDSVAFGATTIYGKTFLVKYNTVGNVVWAKGIKVSVNGKVIGNSVATDNSGNIYLTGSFVDTAYFGSYTLIENLYKDLFLVKYDSSGNIKWAMSGNLTGINSEASGLSITTDDAANIYLSGQYYDSLSFGTHTIYSVPYANVFIAKYDSSGNVINVISAASPPSSIASNYSFKIVSNKWNELYLCGNLMDTMTFGSVQLIPPAFYSTFIVKFDTALNAICGTVINDDNDERNASAIAPDPLTDDIFASADDENGSITFGATTLTGTSEFGFLAKWTCDAVTGNDQPSYSSDNKLIVYPNPNTGLFTISFVGSSDRMASSDGQNFLPATIEIYNVLGKKVYSQFTNHQLTFTIDLSNQPNGIYFYRVLNLDGSLVGEGKVIVQK